MHNGAEVKPLYFGMRGLSQIDPNGPSSCGEGNPWRQIAGPGSFLEEDLVEYLRAKAREQLSAQAETTIAKDLHAGQSKPTGLYSDGTSRRRQTRPNTSNLCYLQITHLVAHTAG